MNLTTLKSSTSSTPSPRSPSQLQLENLLRAGKRSTDAVRAAGYIRVSDVSQVDRYSLAAQERYFTEHCETKAWNPVVVYREEGRSARNESIRKRPVFRQLLEDAVAGKFDVVIVHTLDRWSRSSKVLQESVAKLDQNIVALVSITENLDWSTPEGRLVARTLGNFSELFSDKLAKHTKKGIDERARQGRHLGSLPFGYESCWTNRNGRRS